MPTYSDANGIGQAHALHDELDDLPMRITNKVGCPVAGCPVDLGQYFPLDVRVYKNVQSHHLLLARDCSLEAASQSLRYCSGVPRGLCGQFGWQPTRLRQLLLWQSRYTGDVPTLTEFFLTRISRIAARNSYVYAHAYDVGHHMSSRNHRLTESLSEFQESSGTALWTRPASKAANYVLTFCLSRMI